MHFRDDKFLISCAARSGSTMLCTLIGSHPQALCHHEVFARDGSVSVFGIYGPKRKASAAFDSALKQYRDRAPERFLYDIVFNAQGRRCVGFKLKTDEVFQPDFQAVRDLVAADTDIKIIHLVRHNLIDQYVSHRVVEQTGVHFLRPADERPKVQPFRIDIQRFRAFVADVGRRQQAAYELYGRHRNFTIAYEDIVAPASAILDDLQRFLGIDNRPLSANTIKILDNNRGLILNLDEIESAWADLGRGAPGNRPAAHGSSSGG